MPTLTRLSPSSTKAQVIAALERDGGVIVEDFVSAETLQALLADLTPRLLTQSTGRDAFSGGNTRRMGRLFAHTRRCADIVTHPLFLPVAEHFVARTYKRWAGETLYEVSADLRIGCTQAIQIGPGQGAQPLHRDDNAFLWRHPTNGHEGRVQVMVALSDFTEANGGTLVIPGSHLWDDERKPLLSEAIATEMKAGSALLWLGSTYHAGGANRTRDEYRAGLTITLDAANVRQEENMYLSLSPDVVAGYPETIQRLLGWSAGRNAMGWVEIDGQMADPLQLLRKTDAPITAVTGGGQAQAEPGAR